MLSIKLCNQSFYLRLCITCVCGGGTLTKPEVNHGLGGNVLPGGRFDQGGGVQVMDLVELEQRGQIIELLVADLEPLAGQRIYDIMGNFGVLGHGQNVITGTRGRIPDQKHAVSLSM